MTTSTTSGDGFEQGVQHGLDRLAHELCRVIDDPVVEPCRKILLELVHRLAHVGRELQSVGIRGLEDRNRDRLLVVQEAAYAIGLGADLDARHIAEAHDFAVGAGLDDDVAELLLVREAARGIEGELEIGDLSKAVRRAGPPRPGRSARESPSTTSLAVRLRAASFCGSSQTRIE